MTQLTTKTVVLIVAHPDDETLWAGGTILSHPTWKFFVVCLCRESDEDRAPKFYKALKVLKSEGVMGDLDDGKFYALNNLFGTYGQSAEISLGNW